MKSCHCIFLPVNIIVRAHIVIKHELCVLEYLVRELSMEETLDLSDVVICLVELQM